MIIKKIKPQNCFDCLSHDVAEQVEIEQGVILWYCQECYDKNYGAEDEDEPETLEEQETFFELKLVKANGTYTD